MDREKEKGGDYILIEGGDMLYSPNQKKNISLPHLTLKGGAFFEALKAMGYDLFVPGELDLKAGLETLGTVSHNHGVETIQLNLYRHGRRIFKGYEKIQRAGVDILVTGVIAEEFIKKEYRDWSGYEVRDPRGELEKLWEEKGKESDIFVIVSHMPYRKEKLLTQGISFPALFLSIHSRYHSIPVVAGKSIIVSLPDRGRSVGKLSLKGVGEAKAPFLGYYLSLERGQTIGDGRSIRKGREIRVSFEKISLDEDVAREEQMELLLSGYREKVRNLRFDSPDGDEYMGVTYCKECHAERVKHWLSGSHSLAFETLMVRREEMNPDCLVCHTTGFGSGGYIPRAPLSKELEGVGCEECHGPGKGHPDRKLPVPGEKDCRQCHNRGDLWDFTGARKRIGCERK